MAESKKHRILKQVGLRWVQRTGCVAFASEMAWGWVGIVDVAGIKANGDIYLVEAKVSKSDMLSDTKRNKIYKIRNSWNFDFIYYIVADGVPTMQLPDFIGVINENGRVVRKAKRRPRNNHDKGVDFEKFARALSWRAYGNVIRFESEQPEFSLC